MAEGDEDGVQPRDPDYEGIFSTISLDPALFEIAGGRDEAGQPAPTMSAADMRRYIATQLIEAFDREGIAAKDSHSRKTEIVARQAREIADEIVAWMPRGAMYASVVENLDLRPFVATWGAGDGVDSDRAVFSDEGVQALQGEIRRAYELSSENNAVNQRLGSDELAAAVEQQSSFQTSMVGMSPARVVTQVDQQLDSAVASGQLSVEEAQQQLYDDDPLAAFDADPGQTISFPLEDFRRSLRVGSIENIMDLASREADWISAQLDAGAAVDPTTSFVPVDLGMRARPTPNVPGEMRPQPTRLNAVDAMDYLSQITDGEVEALQRSLARAGYMQNNQGLTYEPGDQMDPLTMAAWQRALYDSARENVPLPKLLVDRAAAEDQRRAEQAAIDDETMFRNGVNGMVRDVLGRELSFQEYQEVRSYITELAQTRAQQVPGQDRRGWEGTTYDNELYGEADVEQAVIEQIGGQAASSASWNAGQKLFQIIGRDFPGTQRVED